MSLALPPTDDPAAFHAMFQSSAWLEAAAEIGRRHSLTIAELCRSAHGENIVIEAGDRYFIKIYAPFRDQFRRELASLELTRQWTALETPRIVAHGEFEGWPYIVMTRLDGTRLTEVWSTLDTESQIAIAVQLGHALRGLHDLPITDAANLDRDWIEFIESQAATTIERQRRGGAPIEWLSQLDDYLNDRDLVHAAASDRVFLHGDVHPGNLMAQERGGQWRLSGLLDFGDAFMGSREYDFVAPGVLMLQGRADLQRACLIAYGYDAHRLDDSLRRRLMLLTILYECSDLRKYALRLRPEAIALSLPELERAIWRFA